MSSRTMISRRIREEIEKNTSDDAFRNLVLEIFQFEVKNWRKNPNYKKELDRMLELHVEGRSTNEN